MFYSSDSSDNEGKVVVRRSRLDFSYLNLDTESVSNHLKNSVDEQIQAQNKELIEDDWHESIQQDNITERLFLDHNMMITLPFEVTLFSNLKTLNLSDNNLTHLNDFLGCLVHLQVLILKNNSITDDGIGKCLSGLTKLRELCLSSNKLTRIPDEVYKLPMLKYLYLGNNEITEVPPAIKVMERLLVLHLGGNQIVQVPEELGQLPNLQLLALCDNNLRRLTRAISNLKSLRSLYLHNNNLCCLPVEIVKLRSLREVSLRDNPLVAKFVNCCAKSILYTPPTLMELAARVIKVKRVEYRKGEVPVQIERYLKTGQRCVNPKCKGVYFASCVEHIKFVDFCGMYRVPLMHYLCSSRCTSSTPAYYRNPSENGDSDEENSTLKKVLLG